MSIKLSVPICGPEVLGEQVTVMVQRPSGGIGCDVQVSVSVNDPVIAMLEMASGVVQELFTTVRAPGSLELPT